jgi:hypothetical protein
MCSERTSRALALAPLLVALALAGCGKRGDPAPPPRTIPQPVADLTVQQRGFEIVLDFGYPKTTMAGLALPGLAEVTLYETTRPAPGGAPPALDARELALAAKPLLTLAGAELTGAISGDRMTVRFPIDPAVLAPAVSAAPPPATAAATPAPAAEAAPPTARYYAVRSLATGGEASPFSNVVSLVPRRPPAPPADLELTATKGGVTLAWKATGEPVEGFRVYRRDATRTGYGAPLATLAPDATGHLDVTAAYGRRYIYTVCALGAKTPPIESAPAGEHEVDYQDRFAPEPPRALRALGGAGEARLLWEASPDPDVAGYVVFRADPGQEFRRVTPEPVPGLDHVDGGLASGFVFRYRVAAIDAAGNLGEPSDAVEANVR